jgi:hypothetical protein
LACGSCRELRRALGRGCRLRRSPVTSFRLAADGPQDDRPTLAAEMSRRGWPLSLPLTLAALLLVGIVSRWLTRAELVQAWDAGNFVLALDGFDPRRHQPHLPAVFWWLISLGRWTRPLLGGNGVAALEMVNAVVSAVALPCGLLLGYRLGGWRTAWWLVALLFSAPVLWFYASQPLSYGAELGWVVALGLCAWCVSLGEAWALAPLALLMATAGGIRPNTPIFLLPLVLLCCLRGCRRGIAAGRLAAAVALGAGVLVLWGHAFLQEAGGFERFWPLLRSWQNAHNEQAAGGSLANGWLLLRTVALTAPAALALALFGMRRRVAEPLWARSAGPSLLRWRGWFLLLWIAPAAAYFLLVHFTRMGHATTLLPPVLLLLALRLAAADGGGALRWPRDLLLVLLLQSLLFLLVPGDRFAASLRDYDREWGAAISAARRYDPATTLVVTTGRSNRRAYRLPSVHLNAYDHGEADLVLDQERETIEVRPPLRRVVLLDRGLALAPPALPGVRVEPLIPGRLQLIEVPVPPGGLEVGRRRVERLEADGTPESASEQPAADR